MLIIFFLDSIFNYFFFSIFILIFENARFFFRILILLKVIDEYGTYGKAIPSR